MISLLAAEAASGSSTVTHEANWFLENAWLIPLFPALSFVGILFFGKRHHLRACVSYHPGRTLPVKMR